MDSVGPTRRRLAAGGGRGQEPVRTTEHRTTAPRPAVSTAPAPGSARGRSAASESGPGEGATSLGPGGADDSLPGCRATPFPGSGLPLPPRHRATGRYRAVVASENGSNDEPSPSRPAVRGRAGWSAVRTITRSPEIADPSSSRMGRAGRVGPNGSGRTGWAGRFEQDGAGPNGPGIGCGVPGRRWAFPVRGRRADGVSPGRAADCGRSRREGAGSEVGTGRDSDRTMIPGRWIPRRWTPRRWIPCR